MKRNDAIYYAKQLVKHILDMYENDDDFKCMVGSEEPINGKHPGEQIIDAYAEWCFPDDEEDEK